jgi:hypothetical protein
MRKLTAVAAALALTGLAACDSIQPGGTSPTTIAPAQQGSGGPAVNPALLPASAFQPNVAGGGGAVQQQGQGGPAVNPALIPADRLQGGTATGGTGAFQNNAPAVRTTQPPRR